MAAKRPMPASLVASPRSRFYLQEHSAGGVCASDGNVILRHLRHVRAELLGMSTASNDLIKSRNHLRGTIPSHSGQTNGGPRA